MSKKFDLMTFFAVNPVAANLLMISIIVLGIYSWNTLDRQLFSTNEIGKISINVLVPGYLPDDIEESVTVKIEEALKDVPQIDRVYSDTGSGYARFVIELHPAESVGEVIDIIKRKLDAIPTFPSAMEPINIDRFHWNQLVMKLVLTGMLDDTDLKRLGLEIRKELLRLDNVKVVDFFALPNFEISIEVHPRIIQKYNIDLQDISSAILSHSSNLSIGEINSAAKDLLIRLSSQSYSAEDYRQIPVVVGEQGQRVLLGEIATVSDQFTEILKTGRFNGNPATSLNIYATERDSMLDVSDSLNRYIEHKNKSLPEGVSLISFADTTKHIEDRVDMMLLNLLAGAALVLILLFLFLGIQVSFWVMIGIPVALLGALSMMLVFNIPINVTTLFAFIMALGIVVDDAIVIGESAHSECNRNGLSTENVLIGVRRVSTPVLFGMFTTMAVFFPMLFASGDDSGQFVDLAAVMIFCVVFSLIESRLILPRHLAMTRLNKSKPDSFRSGFESRFGEVIDKHYIPLVNSCLKNRVFVISIFVALLLIAVSIVTSGKLQVVHLPKVASETPIITVSLSSSATEILTYDVMREIEEIVQASNAEALATTGSPVIKNILSHIIRKGRIELTVELIGVPEGDLDVFALSTSWYDKMINIPGVRAVSIQDEAISNPKGAAIGYRFYGTDPVELSSAAQALMEALSKIEGVYNIASSVSPSVRELSFELKPVAYSLGFSPDSVAQQLRAAFYGIEVQRINRDGQDIRVLVRYTKELRSQRDALRRAHIVTPEGGNVFLGDVVDIVEVQGTNLIRREEGYRSELVLADINPRLTTENRVIEILRSRTLPEILEAHPTVKLSLAGAINERRSQQNQMVQFGVIAVLLVFILIAVPLGSYVQPFFIVSIVPFSMIGAIFGHILMGYQISLFSLFGMVGAIGVVVNDGIVLLNAINRLLLTSSDRVEATLKALKERFKPILLTSLTTFFGLLPIMFETSVQGQYVAPMAISMGFALIASTICYLILLPVLYISVSSQKIKAESPLSLN